MNLHVKTDLGEAPLPARCKARRSGSSAGSRLLLKQPLPGDASTWEVENVLSVPCIAM